MTNFVPSIKLEFIMTQEKVLEALSNVQEPDLGKDLVTLNMVKDINIDGNRVSFTVVLTTPACPLKDVIEKDVKAAMANIGVTSVKLNLTANTVSVHRTNIMEELGVHKAAELLATAIRKGLVTLP